MTGWEIRATNQNALTALFANASATRLMAANEQLDFRERASDLFSQFVEVRISASFPRLNHPLLFVGEVLARSAPPSRRVNICEQRVRNFPIRLVAELMARHSVNSAEVSD